jgi:cell division septation protein DedD
VSDSHDQSYYEIALTNRQVMSIFVVLLVCVLGAFLGGVWLGRDAGAAVEVASTQSIIATDEGGAPLEELDFFTRREQAAMAPDGFQEASAKQEESDAAAASRAQPDANARVQGQRREKPSGGNRPSSSRETETAKPASEPLIEPEGEGESQHPEPVVIQVFSSNEEAQARRVVDQLRQSGYPAILSPVEVAGRIHHRVRIGPYTDPDEAQVVAESVQRAFKFDTWITH